MTAYTGAGLAPVAVLGDCNRKTD